MNMVKFISILIRLIFTFDGTPDWVTFVLMLVLPAGVLVQLLNSTSVNFKSSAFRLGVPSNTNLVPIHFLGHYVLFCCQPIKEYVL